MKRLMLLASLLLTLLLAGCAGPETAPEEGLPGYPSCTIDLTTDGQRVLLLRRGKTYPEWSRTFTVFDVTGGGMRRIVSGHDAADFALLDGRLWVASRTLDWLKAVQISAEMDAYDPVSGASAVHVSARQDEGSEGRINPDFYGFHIAGERLIRQRNFAVDLTYRQEFAFADMGKGYYTAAVNWARAAGVLTGDSATNYATVRPNDPVSRQELCVMLDRYANGAASAGEQLAPGVGADIVGMSKVASWARGSVSWAVNNGVIYGVDNHDGTYSMNPADSTWRASAAKMFTVVMRDVMGR